MSPEVFKKEIEEIKAQYSEVGWQMVLEYLGNDESFTYLFFIFCMAYDLACTNKHFYVDEEGYTPTSPVSSVLQIKTMTPESQSLFDTLKIHLCKNNLIFIKYAYINDKLPFQELFKINTKLIKKLKKEYVDRLTLEEKTKLLYGNMTDADFEKYNNFIKVD